MIMYCDTNQIPALLFCGQHPNPHGARGLSNNYHLLFDPKLGHGICVILRILCDCVDCTSITDQPWISGIPLKQKARYQPIKYCTYWPVLGSYNNWNTIHLTPKSTPFEVFDEIQKVVLDVLGDNMASLVQPG